MKNIIIINIFLLLYLIAFIIFLNNLFSTDLDGFFFLIEGVIWGILAGLVSMVALAFIEKTYLRVAYITLHILSISYLMLMNHPRMPLTQFKLAMEYSKNKDKIVYEDIFLDPNRNAYRNKIKKAFAFSIYKDSFPDFALNISFHQKELDYARSFYIASLDGKYFTNNATLIWTHDPVYGKTIFRDTFAAQNIEVHINDGSNYIRHDGMIYPEEIIHCYRQEIEFKLSSNFEYWLAKK